jgi:putative flippase GtrA
MLLAQKLTMALLSGPLAKTQLIEFAKYVFASAVALAVDYIIYRVNARYGNLALPEAAVAGYLGGLIVAYFLIGEGVFKEGWLKEKKLFEALLFIVSGLIGIAITYLTVTVFVYLFGSHPNQAKIVAVIFSFVSVYLFRKFFVFKSIKAE